MEREVKEREKGREGGVEKYSMVSKGRKEGMFKREGNDEIRSQVL